MSPTDLENVEPHSRRADTLTLDIEVSKPREENVFASDYYEILRVGPQADEDTIERVYGTLADRFHPDNTSTGDPETFLRVREAYETLSNPAKRAKYNVLRQHTKGSALFGLRGREFFDGVRGGQNRRLAVLCLLYRKRISTHDSPGLTILDLERLTGCTREELTNALWYLCEKKWATIGEFTAYSITADGFDFVESKLEHRLEFRSLATLCYYSSPAELEDPAHFEPRFWINDTLSLDIEPARTLEGDVSVADHYEILGIGPQADEEAIERVYHTLAERFHPDNPSTGDAKTFLRIREAYDTLSDQTRRAQYNALRQRTKDPARFRLRGREFFDGIKGEQLRRLAVLCLLYRQSASESPGLTVLNLEQLTGCTREELGSALWYLREKKWAKFGEFTEFSITAAGFDVVETKVEDREAARSQAWLNPEDTRGNEIVYTQVSAALPAAQNQQSVPVTFESPISNTIVPEKQNSQQIVESKHTGIKAEERSEENVEVAQGPVELEEASDNREQGTRLEVGAEPAAESRQSIPVTPLPLIASAATAPAIRNLQTAGISPTDIFQHLLRLQKAEEQSGERLAVTPGPARNEEGSGIAKQGTRFEVGAEPAAQSQQNGGVMPQSLIENTINAPTALGAEEASGEQLAVTQGPAQIEEAPVSAEQRTRFENGAPENRSSHRIAEGEPADINPGRPLRSFVRRLLGFDAGTKPGAPSQRIYQITPEYPIANTIAPENQNSRWIAESEHTDIKAGEPSNENVEVAQPPIPIPEKTLGNTSVSPQASVAETAEQSQQNVPITKAEEPADEQLAVTPVPSQTEEIPGPAEQGIQFEDGAEAQDREAANSRAWLAPEDTHGNEPLSPQTSVGQVAVQSQQNVPVTPNTLDNSNSQIAAMSSTDIKADELSDENVTVTQGPTRIEEAPGIAEPAAGLEDGAELVIESQQNSNSQLAESPADIQAEEPWDGQPAVTQASTRTEEAPGIAEPATGFKDGAELAAQSQQNVPVTPNAPENSNSQLAAMSPTDIKAEQLSDEQPAVTPGPAQIEEAPVPAQPGTRLEDGAEAQVSPQASAAQLAPQSQANVKITPQSPGVTGMNDSTKAIAEQAGGAAVSAAKRVIFSMGGKGGVGKTSVMTGLAEWFDENQIPVTLLDLDTENKACGSLTHFFSGRVPKINIHTPAGLDAFIDHLAGDAPVILADMGAGAGQVTHGWFDMMYPDMAETGVVFTAIGVVTPDPASVESVLNWAAALQDRVDYVIVENNLTEHADFTYWREGDQAQEFQKRFQPAIVRLDNRLADLENAARNYGITLGRVAGRTAQAPELQKASLVMRAQSYRRRMFAEFDKVKELLLP